MNETKTKRILYPFLISLVGSIMMVVIMWLPYATANEEYEKYLMENEDRIYAEEIGMTNGDAVNISLFEFIKIYGEASGQGSYGVVATTCVVIISMYGAMALLTVVMSALRKPVGIIVFDVLTLIMLKIVNFDFEDRGIIPSGRYDWGIASYITYIIGVVVVAGAVWLIIEKKRGKECKIRECEELI